MQASHTPQTTHLEQKKEKGQNKETKNTRDSEQLSYSNTKLNITKGRRLQQYTTSHTGLIISSASAYVNLNHAESQHSCHQLACDQKTQSSDTV